jgi:hypothetical protein
MKKAWNCPSCRPSRWKPHAPGRYRKHAIWTKAATILGHRMAIEVRKESGAVLQAKFIFELEH